MRHFLWLGVVWPLVFFPFLSDPTPVGVRGTGTVVLDSDTTYADGRYAALVPGVTDTITQGTDTMIRVVPDPDSVGTGVAYRAIREPGGNDYLVLTYDTLVTAALDSVQVDSIWSDWGLGTPYAYAVDVPRTGDPVLLALGVTSAESAGIAQVIGFPYKATTYTPALFTMSAYDDTLTAVADTLMVSNRAGINLADANFYDRAAVLYEHFWRTGDTARLYHADTVLLGYRDDYVIPNTDGIYDGVPARQLFPEGLALHWLIRGDTVSRNSLAQLTRVSTGPFNSQFPDDVTDTTYLYIDGRIQSRPLLGLIYCAVLNVPARDYDGSEITRNWDSIALAGVDSMLGFYSRERSGFGPTTGRWYMRGYGWGQANFQVAHSLIYALAMYADLLDDGARRDTIEAIVTASLDSMLTFKSKYLGEPIITYTSFDGSDTTAINSKDLNGIFVGALGWGFNVTGDSAYWYYADSLMDAVLNGGIQFWGMTAPTGFGKQFNQTYWQSQKGIYWRNGGP